MLDYEQKTPRMGKSASTTTPGLKGLDIEEQRKSLQEAFAFYEFHNAINRRKELSRPLMSVRCFSISGN